jgi:hypothetical protein
MDFVLLLRSSDVRKVNTDLYGSSWQTVICYPHSTLFLCTLVHDFFNLGRIFIVIWWHHFILATVMISPGKNEVVGK